MDLERAVDNACARAVLQFNTEVDIITDADNQFVWAHKRIDAIERCLPELIKTAILQTFIELKNDLNLK